jgi:hypothetical protein
MSAKRRLHVPEPFDSEPSGERLVKRQTVEPPALAPSVEPIIKWTLRFHDEGKRPGLMVVPGSTAQDRMTFYRKYLSEEWASFRPDTVEDIVGDPARDWVDQTVLANFTGRIAQARVPEAAKRDLPNWFTPVWAWEFVWALAAVPSFVVEEPLRSMVDQSHYLFHEVYRAVWEMRFRLRENRDQPEAAHQFFNAFVRWLTASQLSASDLAMLEAAGVTRRVTSDQERMDVLFFLLTLAEHNTLLNRYVLCFDGLERALRPEKRSLLREMGSFLTTLDRWIRVAQTPVGVLIGMDTSPRQISALRRMNPKLGDAVVAGMSWIQ